jgi:POTRA domain, FtsQ-type/Cell division protein FtsQ/DivIB, C-terminal
MTGRDDKRRSLIWQTDQARPISPWRVPGLSGPAWPRGRVPWGRLISGAVAVLLLVAVLFFRPYWGALHQIRDVRIEIEGDGVLTAQEIRQTLSIERGDSFFGLQVGRAAERLMSLPRVRAQEIQYRLFHELTVTVLEYHPVGVLISADGEMMEVASDGTVFPPRGIDLADLPILTCETGRMLCELTPGDQIAPEGLSELLALLADLQAAHPRLWDGISEAKLLSGGDFELYWNDFPIVIWGHGVVTENQLLAWTGVMDELQENDELDAVVDLRFQNQILVRLPRDREAGIRIMG